MKPEVDWKRIKVAFFDCFGTVFDMSNVPREQIAAYVEHVKREDFSPYEFPEEWWALKAHPDAREGIGKLRRLLGVRCIAFSNGSWELIHRISGANGIAWSGINSPQAIQRYKPHPEAYQRVMSGITDNPGECLMVTANPTFGDVEGATAVGMQACVIRHGRPNDIIELANIIEEAKSHES